MSVEAVSRGMHAEPAASPDVYAGQLVDFCLRSAEGWASRGGR